MTQDYYRLFLYMSNLFSQSVKFMKPDPLSFQVYASNEKNRGVEAKETTSTSCMYCLCKCHRLSHTIKFGSGI